MTDLDREVIPQLVSKAAGGRPVRWLADSVSVGDYAGHRRTLEVFLADANEQREILHALRPHRSAIEAVAGGPVPIVFHTRRETARIYPEFSE